MNVRWPAATMTASQVSPLESQHQAMYFRWLEFVTIDGKPLRPHVHHVANGGSRHPIEAARLKAQGVTPGVPDISVELWAGKWHGLRIELKRIGERPSPEQRDAILRLRAQDYFAVVAQGFEEARRETTRYLALRFVVVDRWAN